MSKSNESKNRLVFDFRTRSAAALEGRVAPDSGLTLADVADAVIRELGLKHECRYCGGWGPEHE